MKIVVSRKLFEFLRKDFFVNVKGETYRIRFDPYGTLAESGPNGHDRNFITEDKKTTFQYFCYNSDSVITCRELKKEEQPHDNEYNWTKEDRTFIKIGKFLNLIKDNFTEKGSSLSEKKDWWNPFIEQFTNEMKGKYTPLNYQISDEISKIYQTPHSEEAGDLLKKSCMRKGGTHTCGNFSSFYNDICKIVYEVDLDKKLLYRALLWEVEVEGKPRIFLDRVYGTPHVESKMLSIANKNGWIYRKSQTTDRTVYDKDTVFHKEIKVVLPESAIEYLRTEGTPYVDTLCYFTGTHISNQRGTKTLKETSGRRVGFMHCTCCSSSIDVGNEYEIDGETLCSTCYSAKYESCDNCGSTISVDSEDNLNIDGNTYCCERCAQSSGYHICSYCGEWKQNVENIDGEEVCPACLSDRYTYCDMCDQFHAASRVHLHTVEGYSIDICDSCLEDYIFCDVCSSYETSTEDIINENGETVMACLTCRTEIEACIQANLTIEAAEEVIPAEVLKPKRKKKVND